MNMDPYGPAAQGLRAYVAAVARQLNVGPEACSCEIEVPAGAFIALEQRLSNFPTRDLALVWDEEHGWAVAIETGQAHELITLSHLDEDVLPPAETVARFVADILAERYPGRPESVWLRSASDQDDLDSRLAAYGTAAG